MCWSFQCFSCLPKWIIICENSDCEFFLFQLNIALILYRLHVFSDFHEYQGGENDQRLFLLNSLVKSIHFVHRRICIVKILLIWNHFQSFSNCILPISWKFPSLAKFWPKGNNVVDHWCPILIILNVFHCDLPLDWISISRLFSLPLLPADDLPIFADVRWFYENCTRKKNSTAGIKINTNIVTLQ